jgi:hypothetical protein
VAIVVVFEDDQEINQEEWVKRSQSANSLASAAFATKDSLDICSDRKTLQRKDSSDNSFQSGSFSFSDSEENDDKSDEEDESKHISQEIERTSPVEVKRTLFPKAHPKAQEAEIPTELHTTEDEPSDKEEGSFSPIAQQEDDDGGEDEEPDEPTSIEPMTDEPLSLSLTSQPRLNLPEPELYPTVPLNRDQFNSMGTSRGDDEAYHEPETLETEATFCNETQELGNTQDTDGQSYDTDDDQFHREDDTLGGTDSLGHTDQKR